MKYRVITDPGKACVRSHVVSARSYVDAVRKAILFEHDGDKSFKLDVNNIGTIEHVADRGDVNYVATILETPANHPTRIIALPSWAQVDIENFWFWMSCIVTKEKPCR